MPVDALFDLVIVRSENIIGSTTVTGGVVEVLFPVAVSVTSPSMIAVLMMLSPEARVFSMYPVMIILPVCIAVREAKLQKRSHHVAIVGAGNALTKDNPEGKLSVIVIHEAVCAQLFV